MLLVRPLALMIRIVSIIKVKTQKQLITKDKKHTYLHRTNQLSSTRALWTQLYSLNKIGLNKNQADEGLVMKSEAIMKSEAKK